MLIELDYWLTCKARSQHHKLGRDGYWYLIKDMTEIATSKFIKGKRISEALKALKEYKDYRNANYYV